MQLIPSAIDWEGRFRILIHQKRLNLQRNQCRSANYICVLHNCLLKSLCYFGNLHSILNPETFYSLNLLFMCIVIFSITSLRSFTTLMEFYIKRLTLQALFPFRPYYQKCNSKEKGFKGHVKAKSKCESYRKIEVLI